MRSMRTPTALRPGMTIGVCAPSSALRDDRFDDGLASLASLGYRVVLGDHVRDRFGYLAGTDAARAADLTRLFARRDVDAVICARGGYGAVRMVDLIDWEVVAANPKLFIGYSDITTVHLAMERRAGLRTIHGLMVASFGEDLDERARDCFWRVVGQPEPLGAYDTGGATIRTLVGGQAVGALAGGCLTLLSVAAGSADSPDLEGRIVLLEDVDEATYRVDRFIMQLLRTGEMAKAAGFVIGHVTGWGQEPLPPSCITLDRLWRDLIAPLGKPAMVGFPFGHEPNPLTLPLGTLAKLDADAGTLTLLEPAVS